MMEDVLRKLQLTQLEILKVFDGFCREHELKYSRYAGSLLGAVRHQGFIPWDDDLDVCMSRTDYDRFIKLWSEYPVDGYILQNKENTPGFTQSFTKLRKDHTTFLQFDWERARYHTGIFLDIFPVDRIPNGKWNRAVFKARCMLYQLLTREFAPKKGNLVVRIGASVILKCMPKSARPKLRRNMLQKITKYNANKNLECVCIEIVGSVRKSYAADLTEQFVLLPFEDGEFWCFAGWRDHLERKFGDYMQMPPAEEQAWRHHPIIIDFERNLEDLE